MRHLATNLGGHKRHVTINILSGLITVSPLPEYEMVPFEYFSKFRAPWTKNSNFIIFINSKFPNSYLPEGGHQNKKPTKIWNLAKWGGGGGLGG